MVAFEVLSKICQQHKDELTGSAAGTFPRVDPSTTVWAQRNSNVLIRDQDEWADNSSPAISARTLWTSGRSPIPLAWISS